MGFQRFVATTPGHLVRKVAIDYLRFGYWRYKQLEIPQEKDPCLVDDKLIDFYDITTCGMKRLRRRQKGLANVVFVRFRHSFILLATEGEHPAFNQLKSYDLRFVPLHFCGYSVGAVNHKPCICICRLEWEKIKYRFGKIGLHNRGDVERKLNALPYYNFPGVRKQKIQLVNQVNRRRKKAGLPLITLTLPQYS